MLSIKRSTVYAEKRKLHYISIYHRLVVQQVVHPQRMEVMELSSNYITSFIYSFIHLSVFICSTNEHIFNTKSVTTDEVDGFIVDVGYCTACGTTNLQQVEVSGVCIESESSAWR